MAETAEASDLLDVYVAVYGSPEKHTPETGEWSGRLVCSEDAEAWPCRMKRALDALSSPPGQISGGAS